MLQLETKWFTNTLAKKSMLNNDFIACSDNKRLYVVSYGELTTSGKNTYNVAIKDENDVLIREESNLYLDAITKIILGSTPKTKANKENETNENEVKQPKKQTTEATNKECLLLTFDEAFTKACKQMEAYKEVAKTLGKYDAKDVINLTLHLIKEANKSEKQRIKDEIKQANIKALKHTLELAMESQNETLIEQITKMLILEESL